MLSPDRPFSQPVLVVALVGLVIMLAVRAIRKDRDEYRRFKRFERTVNRQRMMRRWLISSLGVFGGASAVLLVLVWQYIPLVLRAVDAWPVASAFRSLIDSTGDLVPGLAPGLGLVLVFGTVLAVYLARNSDAVPTVGDVGSLLPRNRAELYYGAALSVNAGVVEELLFRLALPALIFGATGSATAAVIMSIVLFGGLHVYQGVPGIVGASVLGAILMALYLATGNILVPIIVHALIDLRSLVLIPVLVYRVDRV